MSTTKNEKPAMTIEQLAEMLEKMNQGMSEIHQGQEKAALNLQNLDQRMTKLEGIQHKVDTEERVEAAIEAVKPGVLGSFKQASTTKKVLIATAATAGAIGIAYGGYKGYEYYQDRKAAQLPLLAVEAVPSVTPAKSDAIRQSLTSK